MGLGSRELTGAFRSREVEVGSHRSGADPIHRVCVNMQDFCRSAADNLFVGTMLELTFSCLSSQATIQSFLVPSLVHGRAFTQNPRTKA